VPAKTQAQWCYGKAFCWCPEPGEVVQIAGKRPSVQIDTSPQGTPARRYRRVEVKAMGVVDVAEAPSESFRPI